jgi:hypothetical protein
LLYDFDVNSGQSYTAARELATSVNDKISSGFEGNLVLKQLGHYHLLQYLHHFEHTDRFLKLVLAKKSLPSVTLKGVSRHEVPHLKKGIFPDRIGFDLFAIRKNLSEKIKASAYSDPKTIIFDPETGRISAVPDEALEILEMCDGKNSIKKISQRLASKYHGPPDMIEKAVTTLLDSMAKNGYITI